MPDITVHPGSETPKAVRAARDELHRQNDAATGVDFNYQPFYLTAEEDGRLVGYLHGHTGSHEVYVDDVIVDGTLRHGGTGRALMQALEDHFAGGDFSHIYLTTYEYQAPGFYEKCGYTLEYMRPYAKDARLNKYHFVKYLK